MREPHVRIWKLKIKLDKDTTEKKYRLIKETDLQLYTFKNEKEVVCLNEKNCQSNSSNSDKDLSDMIEYFKYIYNYKYTTISKENFLYTTR